MLFTSSDPLSCSAENVMIDAAATRTSKDDILLIVEPVLMQPLRREWEVEGISANRRRQLQSVAEGMLLDFMERLAKVRVMDPACGSGNFLYVALNELKNLEKEVWAYAGGVVLVPFAVLVAILFGFELNERLRECKAKDQPATPPTPSDRAKMLDKVENFWIEAVLKQSLYQIARVDLGLERAPERVNHPWGTIVQRGASTPTVAPGTQMVELFDDLDGAVLILGAPGAGKTTLLLELARDLIARARKDDKCCIPLVFNLSTWASKQQTIKAWLANELNQRYDVPQKLAQQWVEAALTTSTSCGTSIVPCSPASRL